MHKVNHTKSSAEKRKLRVRRNLFGTAQRPRLSVFRSNRYMYIQAIDDQSGVTLASVSDVTIHQQKKSPVTKTESAKKIAEEFAKALLKKGVTSLVFDRGAYRYHGRVKAVADALRAQAVEV